METITVSEARERLYRLVDEVGASSEPILITGKRSKAVLVSEDDWRAIEETLHLVSTPGMRESIREGMATTLDECSSEPGRVSWRVVFTAQARKDARRAAAAGLRGRIEEWNLSTILRHCFTVFSEYRCLSVVVCRSTLPLEAKGA